MRSSAAGPVITQLWTRIEHGRYLALAAGQAAVVGEVNAGENDPPWTVGGDPASKSPLSEARCQRL